MTIFGHGSSGDISVGAGDMATSVGSADQSLVIQDIDLLLPLKPYFCKGAHLHLEGCHVGQGSDGQALIKALAKELGITVSAGVGWSVGGLINLGGSTSASP